MSACQGASLNGRSSKAKVGFVCGVNQEDLSPCLGLSPCSLMFARFPQRSSVLGSSCAGVAGVALLTAPAGCPVWPRWCGPGGVSSVAPAGCLVWLQRHGQRSCGCVATSPLARLCAQKA